MTIAAAYLTSEGVVVGADSTTTISAPGVGVVQLLDHAQKVFEIGENSHYCLCTDGAAKIGNLSHRTIVARLADSMPPIPTVITVADQLVSILTAQASSAGTTPFDVGYFLGGVDVGHEAGCVRITFNFSGLSPTGAPNVVSSITPLTIGEARFAGGPDYFTRLFHGFAQGLPEAILTELQQILTQQGTLPPGLDAAFMQAFANARPRFASAGYSDLPLREAIDYVHTYMAVTIKALKFRFGPPLCGGPIEIGYVSTDRRFRWARHKRFDSAIAEHIEAP